MPRQSQGTTADQAALTITRFSANAAISAGENPASPRTSALCSPMRGGWRRRPGRSRAVAEFDRQRPAGRPSAFGAAGARDEDVEQPAGRQQMRVGEQIAGLADRRPGDVGALAASRHLVLRQACRRPPCSAGISQARSASAHQVGGEARIGGQLLQPELLDEAGPLLVAGDADEQLPVAAVANTS